jgi:putative ABC transport system permease protein
MLDPTLRDFRYVVRSLAKSRGLTLAALLTLALGMGANTAIFTAVQAILLRPLDVAGLDRLVVMRDDIPGLNLRNIETEASSVEAYGKRTDLFDAVGASLKQDYALTGFGDTTRVAGSQTVGPLFRAFGLQPFLGRFYEPGEEQPGRNLVAVLNYGFWQRVFGGDRNAVGRRIELDGNSYEIVGVLPASFQFPRNVEVFTPMPSNSPMRGANALLGVALMRPGLSIQRVQAQVDTLSRELAQKWELNPKWGFSGKLFPFVEFQAGQLRPVLLVLMGAVGFVLLTACANLAGLQLARATARAKEFAVRVALGASRWDIVRQALLESVILAAAGGTIGLLIGSSLLQALGQWKLPGMPEAPLTLNPGVLLFTALIAIVAGLGFGIVPALRASRADAQTAMRDSSRGSSGSRRHRILETLAVAQVGLALVLLVASGLLVRSLGNLLAASPGFRAQQLISMQLALPGARYKTTASERAFSAAMEDRLQHLPGITSAGLTSELPFTGAFNSSPFRITEKPARPGEPLRHANIRRIDSGFFQTMGIPLLKGRNFANTDAPGAPFVAIIDAQLAKEYFPGEDPIGKHVDQGTPALIVGIAGSVSHAELGEPLKATIYYSARQSPTGRLFVVVRTALQPGPVAAMVRTALNDLDKNVPLFDVRPMPERIANSLSARRLAEFIMLGFALLAVILAVLGTYGVLSYSIGQRTHEFGIRMALGAQRGGIIAMVLRKGLGLACAGLACGALAAWWLARLLSSLLYGVSPRDPLTLCAAVALLAAVTLIACYVPARRAASVDPGITLRWE